MIKKNLHRNLISPMMICSATFLHIMYFYTENYVYIVYKPISALHLADNYINNACNLCGTTIPRIAQSIHNGKQIWEKYYEHMQIMIQPKFINW